MGHALYIASEMREGWGGLGGGGSYGIVASIIIFSTLLGWLIQHKSWQAEHLTGTKIYFDHACHYDTFMGRKFHFIFSYYDRIS